MFNKLAFFVIFLLVLNSHVLSHESKVGTQLHSIGTKNPKENRKINYDNIETYRKILARRIERLANKLNGEKGTIQVNNWRF